MKKDRTPPCRVSASVYFVMFVACLIVLDNSGLMVFALLCVGVHELGHLVMLRLCRAKLVSVEFRLFGIRIRMRDSTRLSYGQELMVALAGSGANLLFGALAAGLYALGFFPKQMGVTALFSLLIGGFNLLPIAALDGGTALESLLCAHLRPDKAARVVDILSFCLIVPLGVAGLLLVLKTRFNFSLVFVTVYLAALLLMKKRRHLSGTPGKT